MRGSLGKTVGIGRVGPGGEYAAVHVDAFATDKAVVAGVSNGRGSLPCRARQRGSRGRRGFILDGARLRGLLSDLAALRRDNAMLVTLSFR